MKSESKSWATTLHEMFTDRKYKVEDLQCENIIQDLTQTDSKDFFVYDSQDKCVCIAYLSSDQTTGNVGKNDIITIMNDKMKPNGSNRCIIILDNVKLTPAAKTEIQLHFPLHIFETFDISSLDFNITKCDTVPNHMILSDEEAEKVLKKYKITRKEMPKILYEDAVARYLGMLPGQICKITRISENGGLIFFHRVCIL